MNAEIVGVGTELLLGQIANTNAQKISQSLATVGVDVLFHTAVGDNLQRMTEVIDTAARRCDVVIVTGGLGPTPDDITREGIAAAFDLTLERNDQIVSWLQDFFTGRGREMPEENLQQADLPAGATMIDPEGTAPGFFIEHDHAIVFALPGVPWEMSAMLAKVVLPELRRRTGDAVLVSREILTMGLGESHVHERIRDLVAGQSNPTIAFLAGGGNVRIRMSAKAASESEALGLIGPLEKDLRERLGDHAAPGYHSSPGGALTELLRQRGITVAVAESLTGGLIGAELTGASGSGDFFLGALVCYATRSKSEVAGVDPAILDGPGPVSEEAAAALAKAAAHRFGADLGLSATGVAGPAEQDGRPVGTIFVGAAFEGRTEVRPVTGYGDRSNIRTIAMNSALDLGRRVIESGD